MAMALVPYVGAGAVAEMGAAADSLELVGYQIGQEMVRRGGDQLKNKILDYMKQTGQEMFDNGVKRVKDWAWQQNEGLRKGTYPGVAPFNVTVNEADMGRPMEPGMRKKPKQYFPRGRTYLPPTYWYLRRKKKRTYKRKY